MPRPRAYGGGASNLTKKFASEQDRVNCPFYYKVGSCRHGSRCDRHHLQTSVSTTVLFTHLYQNPKGEVLARGQNPDSVDEDKVQEDFEEFFIDVFEECSNYGEIEDMMVADNLADHMVGNVYVKFFREEDADECKRRLNKRFYDGRLILGELTHARDFTEARCRQFDQDKCTWGYYCNFVHPKYIDSKLLKKLRRDQPHAGENEPEEEPETKRRRSRSRSFDRRSRDRRSRSRSRDRRRSHGRKERRRDR